MFNSQNCSGTGCGMSTASVVLPESYRIELAHKAATKVNIAPVDAIQALVDAGFIVPLKK